MATIRLTATAGADGVLRLALPVGAGEYEVAVEVTPKPPAPARTPTPEELGWPPGWFDKVVGSLDDSFQLPPRTPNKPAPRLDADA
jgi:hypothetical protein